MLVLIFSRFLKMVMIKKQNENVTSETYRLTPYFIESRD